MPLDAEKEIEYLRNQILDHDYRYYTLAQPVISDEEYDLLMHRLLSLEQQHPDLLAPDSPSQRVGGRPLKEFSTVTHIIPMLSLANTYNEEDIRAFDRRIAETLGIGAYRYVCELKFDGVAVTLHYHRGILTLGATRGDGMQGDDISQNLKTIRSIPLRLHAQSSVPDFCEVRGEIFMKRSDFEHMNEERRRKDFYESPKLDCGNFETSGSEIGRPAAAEFFCLLPPLSRNRSAEPQPLPRRIGGIRFAGE